MLVPKTLYRQPVTMSLWAIPYKMKEGQSPQDLLHTIHLWDWWGSPGWYGSIPAHKIRQIRLYLEALPPGTIPEYPGEWSEPPELAPF